MPTTPSPTLLSLLQALNPAQFAELIQRLNAPEYHLRHATQTEQAIDLIRYLGTAREEALQVLIRQVRMPFAVHILHCDSDREWAQTLAQNLADNGIKVAPLDPNHLRPAVWQQAQRVILVAGEASIADGWVSEQYQRLAHYTAPGFCYLPVLREAVVMPFSRDVNYIDFSDDYAQSFQALWQTLNFELMPPPSHLLIPPEPQTPPQASAALPAFIAALFEHYQQASPVPQMLLVQKGWNQPWIVDTLLAQAERLYPRRAWHIAAPYNEDENSFFQQLAAQCGLQAHSQATFEHALKQDLKDGKAHFLLISRFENSFIRSLQALARTLRDFNETHANHLHILLLGGENLYDLKYQEGTHSILNIAEPTYWAEPAPGDAPPLVPHADPQLAADLLAQCGGYPPLLRAAVQMAQCEGKPDDARLSEASCVWELFTSLHLNPREKATLRDWLDCRNTALAAWKPYLFNALLRDLFWRGVLVRRERRLYWRCEAMRLAGLEILEAMG